MIFPVSVITSNRKGFALPRPNVRRWHWLLATSSRLLLMDFRELKAVHDLVIERDADKNGVPGEVSAFSDYLPAIGSVWLQRNRKTDILRLITWQLPFFSWHLRVAREGVLDMQHFAQELWRLLRSFVARL